MNVSKTSQKLSLPPIELEHADELNAKQLARFGLSSADSEAGKFVSDAGKELPAMKIKLAITDSSYFVVNQGSDGVFVAQNNPGGAAVSGNRKDDGSVQFHGPFEIYAPAAGEEEKFLAAIQDLTAQELGSDGSGTWYVLDGAAFRQSGSVVDQVVETGLEFRPYDPNAIQPAFIGRM